MIKARWCVSFDLWNAMSALVLLIAALSAITLPGVAGAQSISISSGNNQTGTVATALANPLRVRVRTSGGGAVPGVTVTFSVTLNNGSVNPTSAVTDSTGRASSSF